MSSCYSQGCDYCKDNRCTRAYTDKDCLYHTTKRGAELLRKARDYGKSLGKPTHSPEELLEAAQKEINRLANLLNIEKLASQNISEVRAEERAEWKAKLDESLADNLAKQSRINDLESKLSDAISLAFKIGQQVYIPDRLNSCIYDATVIGINVQLYEKFEYNYVVYTIERHKDKHRYGVTVEEAFSTLEEAQAKLKEMTASE